MAPTFNTSQLPSFKPLIQLRLKSVSVHLSGVSRVVCGGHLHLLAPWATRLLTWKTT